MKFQSSNRKNVLKFAKYLEADIFDDPLNILGKQKFVKNPVDDDILTDDETLQYGIRESKKNFFELKKLIRKGNVAQKTNNYAYLQE